MSRRRRIAAAVALAALLAVALAVWHGGRDTVAPELRGATASTRTGGSLPTPASRVAPIGAPIERPSPAGDVALRGRVIDVGGGAVAGAKLTARADGAAFTAVTGHDGTFALWLVAADYELTVVHDDYATAYQRVDVEPDPPPIDIVLVPAGTVHGQVIARDTRQPVADALVACGCPADDVTTDAEGRFALSGVVGALELSASARSYASAMPTTVAVGIGERVDGVTLVVDHAVQVRGRVVMRGQPVSGVDVTAYSPRTRLWVRGRAPTTADGTFELVGVRPAPYRVDANVRGTWKAESAYFDVADRDVEGVLVDVDPGATITGRVVPAAGAKIGVESTYRSSALANDLQQLHADSDADGAFVLHGVPTGRLSITAHAADGADGFAIVTVTGDRANVVIRTEPRATVSGRVVDTDGHPATGMTVSVANVDPDGARTDSFESSARTDANGGFRVIGLVPGHVRVTATVPELAREGWSDGTAPRDATTILDLTAGATRTDVLLSVPAHTGAIEGIARDADGVPAADVWVTARRQIALRDGTPVAAYDESGRALTDARGHFAIASLAPGVYTLDATTVRADATARRQGVHTGDRAVQLALASAGALTGRVTDAGAPVTAFELDCDGPGNLSRHVIAADGRYLARVEPGHFHCRADADVGYAEGDVVVTSGPARLDLAIRRWARVTGRVVDARTGAPVAGLAIESGLDLLDRWSAHPPVTDRDGVFAIAHADLGPGELAVVAPSSNRTLARRDFTPAAGEQIDVGTIRVVAPAAGRHGDLGIMNAHTADPWRVQAVPGGPAARAGLQDGDVLVAVDGRQVTSDESLIADMLEETAVGQRVELTLARGVTIAVVAE